MTSKMRTCCVCRTQYQFCPVCNNGDSKKPSWYFTFCSENCREIYGVTSDFENGKLTDVQAKEQLEKLNISKLEDFGTSYRFSIGRILAAPTKKERVKIRKPKKEDIIFEPTDEVACDVE